MKILTLIWSVGLGGTERAAVNYAIGYKQYGCDSRVLVLGDGDERYADLVKAGVDTILLNKLAGKEEDILTTMRQWQPGIIHIHNFSPALLAYINKVKGPATKLVETNVFSRPVYTADYKAVDLSMQLTSWGYWRYKRQMKGAAYTPSITVVPNIVDDTKFTTPSAGAIIAYRNLHHIPQGAFVAGRIGQASPHIWDKGLIDVINGTIDPSNDIYYLLAGGLPDSFKTFVEAQSDFFKSRVKLIGRIDGDEQLALYYHSIDCFVHFTRIGESFGYVLTEAMLCGKPVITKLTPLHGNGQFEVVGQNKGGICVAEKKDFIKELLRIYSDRSAMATVQQNLQNGWVQQRYSFAAVMPGLLRMYAALLEGKPIPANYDNNIIESFFRLYKKQFLRSWLVKCTNTYWFVKLLKLVR